MGVKWLARWLPPTGVFASPHHEALLARAIESLNARAATSDKRDWELTCRLLKQAPAANAAVAQTRTGGMGTLKDMWLVQSSESLDTCCLVSRPESQVIDAEKGLIDILEKKLEYRTRSYVKFEGKKYSLGDFNLILSTTTMGLPASAGHQAAHHLVGHVIELEYRPLSHCDEAAAIMTDMIDIVREAIATATAAAEDEVAGVRTRGTGSLEVVPIPYEKFPGLPVMFGRQHVAVAYSRLSVVLLSRPLIG